MSWMLSDTPNWHARLFTHALLTIAYLWISPMFWTSRRNGLYGFRKRPHSRTIYTALLRERLVILKLSNATPCPSMLAWRFTFKLIPSTSRTISRCIIRYFRLVGTSINLHNSTDLARAYITINPSECTIITFAAFVSLPPFSKLTWFRVLRVRVPRSAPKPIHPLLLVSIPAASLIILYWGKAGKWFSYSED